MKVPVSAFKCPWIVSILQHSRMQTSLFNLLLFKEDSEKDKWSTFTIRCIHEKLADVTPIKND